MNIWVPQNLHQMNKEAFYSQKWTTIPVKPTETQYFLKFIPNFGDEAGYTFYLSDLISGKIWCESVATGPALQTKIKTVSGSAFEIPNEKILEILKMMTDKPEDSQVTEDESMMIFSCSHQMGFIKFTWKFVINELNFVDSSELLSKDLIVPSLVLVNRLSDELSKRDLMIKELSDKLRLLGGNPIGNASEIPKFTTESMNFGRLSDALNCLYQFYEPVITNKPEKKTVVVEQEKIEPPKQDKAVDEPVVQEEAKIEVKEESLPEPELTSAELELAKRRALEEKLQAAQDAKKKKKRLI